MIEFKTIPFSSNFHVDDWEELTDLSYRKLADFEFEYCRYRIGGIDGIVYTSRTPEFVEAFKKEMMWNRLKK